MSARVRFTVTCRSSQTIAVMTEGVIKIFFQSTNSTCQQPDLNDPRLHIKQKIFNMPNLAIKRLNVIARDFAGAPSVCIAARFRCDRLLDGTETE